MSSLVAKQQLQQAWALTLEDPEWAAALRQRLDILDQDAFLGQIAHCSAEAWRELARQLRSGRINLTQARQKSWTYLTPSPEFVKAWQRRQNYVFAPRPLRVDPWLYRSPQPRAESLQEIRRVVNLRQESQLSQALCQQLGLSYISIPVPDQQTPQLDQVLQFLRLFQEPQTTLVHCFAGQGRTGLFVACYRIWRGIDVESAIAITDREVGSRGMRPHQRDWVRQHFHHLV